MFAAPGQARRPYHTIISVLQPMDPAELRFRADHVNVALLRAAGLPARYVSGYLHPNPAAEPGQTAVGESQAWVEYWTGT